MKIFNKFAIICIVLLITKTTEAQNITGKWKTIDDKTNKARSVVEIYQGSDGKYYGKVVEIFPAPGEDPNPRCTECSKNDSRYNQPVKGMVIIRGLEKSGSKFVNGRALDPETGNEYSCQMWRDGKNLIIRGYIGFSFAGRSQTWLPYN